MSEYSYGKHIPLWLAHAWQSDANCQIKIVADQQKVKHTNYFTLHSVYAIPLQRRPQTSQQSFIGPGPIKTAIEKTIKRTLPDTAWEMSRARSLLHIRRLVNRFRITPSHN